MSDFWRRISCSHREISPADEDGNALCSDCGGLVRAGPLTEREFFDAMQAAFRSPHIRACVRIDDEWVCPPHCPAAH